MHSRRNFIHTTAAALTGLSLLPALNLFAADEHETRAVKPPARLRFALASDGHYAQPDTNSDQFYTDMMGWLTREHRQNHLDFVIINGDLVHNRPDLLGKVKTTYLDKLPVPYYTLPGNHDFADSALWKSVFGYEDHYTIEHQNIGFVLANTADTKGNYVCPDINFLRTSLEGFKRKDIVFVVLHIAPHQWLPEEAKIFTSCPDVIELLHSYPNVKACFHGHDHTLDGVRYTGKLPHFFDSHFGGNWGTAYKGYRVVEVGIDNHIATYQVNASQNPQLNTNQL